MLSTSNQWNQTPFTHTLNISTIDYNYDDEETYDLGLKFDNSIAHKLWKNYSFPDIKVEYQSKIDILLLSQNIFEYDTVRSKNEIEEELFHYFELIIYVQSILCYIFLLLSTSNILLKEDLTSNFFYT